MRISKLVLKINCFWIVTVSHWVHNWFELELVEAKLNTFLCKFDHTISIYLSIRRCEQRKGYLIIFGLFGRCPLVFASQCKYKPLLNSNNLLGELSHHYLKMWWWIRSVGNGWWCRPPLTHKSAQTQKTFSLSLSLSLSLSKRGTRLLTDAYYTFQYITSISGKQAYGYLSSQLVLQVRITRN